MMSLSPAPVPEIGIVGAGQLARMMMQAAIPLGIRLAVLATNPNESAAQVIPGVVQGSPDNCDDLVAFSRRCQVVTFDHELVSPTALAAAMETGACLRPSPATLVYAQDKRYQREQLHRFGFPVPPFRLIRTTEELADFAAEHGGWPVVIKTPRGGYDGRGVWVVEHLSDAPDLLAKLNAQQTPVLAEQFLQIEKEIAVLIARRPSGEIAVYPVVETIQQDGICHEVIAPAPIPDQLKRTVQEIGLQIAEAIELTGIMAVELFLHNDQITINELATRPHNSGHFSIEGCVTSQFEQHLRAVLDLPLGSTAMTAPVAVMANILGPAHNIDLQTTRARALSIPGVHLHWYGKAARPGRKLGHVTTLGDDFASTRQRAQLALTVLTQ